MKKHHGGTASVATPQEQADKTKMKTSSPCASTSGESDTDSGASVEPCWSALSESNTNPASLDIVWNDDLLDTLACMLDDNVEMMHEMES
ncbi:hypothetical protein PHMEG_00025277 [Phytophthora megakarya]|uniref:Uncharacterized protein n=1 Tax=Phytophthora megakarya TaxID=4795 RepID=A0A225VE18_9STRA|nr:hypothetical protein PHMEG_00025277 [Phytophthora megakarya]